MPHSFFLQLGKYSTLLLQDLQNLVYNIFIFIILTQDLLLVIMVTIINLSFI